MPRDPGAVHWDEGLFLSPHHFQAAERHARHLAYLGEAWDQPHYWGLQDIDLDLDALANHRLVVRSLKARLRDGTSIVVPEDGLLPEMDLQGIFSGAASPTTLHVLLALPVLQEGRANVPMDKTTTETRYRVEMQPFADENRTGNARDLGFRRLNFKLMLLPAAEALPPGYEALVVARLARAMVQNQPAPRLDVTYIPPLLACSAWKPLWVDVLQNLNNRIGESIHSHVNLLKGRVNFDTQAPGYRQLLSELQELNEASALLENLAYIRGIHPLPVYLELCRLVGKLAIFDLDVCRPPALPRYDHDNLGGCFAGVMKEIDHLLRKLGRPPYDWRDFEGFGKQMRTTLQPEWLESPWEMYVGVKSDLSRERCVDLLTSPNVLNMKIGSSETVDRTMERRLAGLSFAPIPDPPAVLPRGVTYFQVKHDPAQEWEAVRQFKTLAVRLNDQQILGTIDRKNELTVRFGSTSTQLIFTLYLVKQQRAVPEAAAPKPAS